MRSKLLTPADIREEQHGGIAFLKANPFGMLWAKVGMGKSLMALTVVADDILPALRKNPRLRVLVVAPIRVCYQVWPTEVQEWTHLQHLTVEVLRADPNDPAVKEEGRRMYAESRAAGLSVRGSTARAKRFELIAQRRARESLMESDAMIHVVDKGSFDWLFREHDRQKKPWPYLHIFVDESSCLGEYDSQISQAMYAVRPMVLRLNQLTGTPASQTKMKLFSQARIADLGKRLGKRVTHFRNNYAIQNAYTKKWTLRPGAEVEIENRLQDIVHIMKKDRRPDEEPLVVRRPIILPTDIMERYNDFEESSIMEIDDLEIEAVNAGVLYGKLLQAASGAIYDDARRWHLLHDAKIEELRDLVEELQGEQLLVAYWHRSSRERLMKAFPKAPFMDKEGKMVREWNSRKRGGPFFIHPQSASHGLNMQWGGHNLASFDLFPHAELFEQIIGRLDRDPQPERVVMHLLTCLGTHDEVVADQQLLLQGAENAMFQRVMAIHRRLRGRR